MSIDWAAARAAFAAGQILAYPTEAVFGLGCDPRNTAALQRLLRLKQRAADKGMIVLAADLEQAQVFVDQQAISAAQWANISNVWPGFVTQLLPAAAWLPAALCGKHRQVAIRVTAFEPARQLCQQLGSAIVSTSANISGQPALTEAAAVREAFGQQLGWVLDLPCGGASRPSRIIDPISQRIIRE